MFFFTMLKHCVLIQTLFVFIQAEMERALLQGERRAELDQVEAELEIINQLQHKLSELDSATQREKEKVCFSLWVLHNSTHFFFHPVFIFPPAKKTSKNVSVVSVFPCPSGPSFVTNQLSRVTLFHR